MHMPNASTRVALEFNPVGDAGRHVLAVTIAVCLGICVAQAIHHQHVQDCLWADRLIFCRTIDADAKRVAVAKAVLQPIGSDVSSLASARSRVPAQVQGDEVPHDIAALPTRAGNSQSLATRELILGGFSALLLLIFALALAYPSAEVLLIALSGFFAITFTLVFALNHQSLRIGRGNSRQPEYGLPDPGVPCATPYQPFRMGSQKVWNFFEYWMSKNRHKFEIARELAMERSPVGIVVIRNAAEVVSLNDQALGMLDLHTGYACIRDVTQLFRYVRPVGVSQDLPTLLQGTDCGEVSCELKGLDGKRLWLKIKRYRPGFRRDIFSLITICDVTQFRTAQFEWHDTLDFVSHDVRLMLNAVQANLSAINRPEISPDASRRIAGAQECLKKSLALTESLLACMTLEHSEEVKIKRLDLAEVVGSACEDAQILSKSKHIRLNCDLNESANVHGNYSLLYRAIFNLIENATKHSPSGSIIAVDLSLDKSTVKLAISDQGCGIPHDVMTGCSEGVYVGSAASSGPNGFGLGMRFVRQVAKVHDVNLAISNAPGGGATVEMVFRRFRDLPPARLVG
jgi:signal transduction histidine kinase